MSTQLGKMQIVPAKLMSSEPKTILCPADKSLTHRALMFGGLAKGRSVIQNPLLGADCWATLNCLQALGCDIQAVEKDAGVQVILESPGWDGWQSPQVPLDFGNSGTTARLLLGLLAARPGLFCTAFGDASLSARPMGRVIEPLRAMGAQIHCRDQYLPLAVNGLQLNPIQYEYGKASAQVKSAVMLAALNVEGTTQIRLPTGSRDHTERLFSRQKLSYSRFDDQGTEIIAVQGPQRPQAMNSRIPVDPSSAAFFMVLGCLHPELQIRVPEVMENLTRLGFLKVLEAMGAKIEQTELPQDFIEPTVDISVKDEQELMGCDVKSHQIPSLIDEIPILAVAATQAKGTTRFQQVAELRVKESDRLAKTIQLLSLAGFDVQEVNDDLIVNGAQVLAKPFDFDPQGDHRLAMAAAILASYAEGPCTIHGPSCVDVSFPGFFPLLRQCGITCQPSE